MSIALASVVSVAIIAVAIGCAFASTANATIIVGFATLVIGQAMHYVQEVKSAEIGKQTHALVNSAMGTQLKNYAIAQRTIATMKNTPESIASAEDAEAQVVIYEQRQKVADSHGSR